MRFLRTTMATDWPQEDPIHIKITKLLLWFIPRGIPDYEKKMHLIREWLIEFSDEGEPWREVGLDENGTPVVSGPDDRNYGFWSDSPMRWENFEGDEVTKEEFETAWRQAAPLRHGEVPSVDELPGKVV